MRIGKSSGELHGRELFRDHGTYHLRIGLALRKLHHLTDEEPGGSLLASLVVLNDVRIRRNSLVDKRFERTGVAHGSESAFFDDSRRIAALLEDFRQKFLERRTVDRSLRGKFDERAQSLRLKKHKSKNKNLSI